MSDHRPFSSDGFVAAWRSQHGQLAEQTVEALSLRWENEAWTATLQLADERADAVFRLSPLWHLRQFMLFRDLDQPDLWLGTDGHGRWGEVNGAHRPELDGAFDIVLPGALFPHAIPIRRLTLAPGEAAQLSVLRVDVETLAVVPVPYTYERLGSRRWLVLAGHQPAQVDAFDVDAHGVPIDGTGRRRQTVAM